MIPNTVNSIVIVAEPAGVTTNFKLIPSLMLLANVCSCVPDGATDATYRSTSDPSPLDK